MEVSDTEGNTRLLQGAPSGGRYELVDLRLGSTGKRQHNKIQFRGGIQRGSVIQTAALEQQPLPEARRQAMELVQALLHVPHAAHLGFRA